MEENKYPRGILSLTISGERISKGLTIEELAEKANIKRETLNYAELSTEGRKLKLEDLIKIADVLEVSLDYLVGRVKEKNAIAHDLNLKEWGNNTLGSFDSFMEEINDKKLSYDMNAYIFVTYMNNNVLEEVLNKIRNKMERKEDLRRPEVLRVGFLADYVTYVRGQKTRIYDYLRLLVNEEWADNYIKLENECYKLREYHKNKDIKINFDYISKFQSMLKVFEAYLSYNVDNKLQKSKEDMINKINKQDNYFRKILRYFEEVS